MIERWETNYNHKMPANVNTNLTKTVDELITNLCLALTQKTHHKSTRDAKQNNNTNIVKYINTSRSIGIML